MNRDSYIAVVPLCFTLSSRTEPYKVQIHPVDITVEPGEAYAVESNLQPTANEMNSPFLCYCLAPHGSSL